MPVFYIITSGCADNTSGQQGKYKFGLLDIFFNYLCDNITSQIPENFTQIVIKHHDILYYAKRDGLNKASIEYSINKYIKANNYKLDSRITHHSFTTEELDVSTIEYPHLIIDWAHIFEYVPGKIIRYNDYYDRQTDKQPLPIKAIYPNWNDEFIAQQQLFKIYSDGTIRTYIDCLDDAGFITHIVHDPIQLLNSIVQQIKSDLMKIWRAKKGKVLTKDCGGTFDDMFSSFDVFKKIINKLFEGQVKEQILDIKTYDFYEHFNSQVENDIII